MPQRRPHAGKELIGAERFGYIVVGADIQRLNLCSFIAAT